MDWQQVVLNGGPPCFHIDADRSFCGRAHRWAGHDVLHKFVSLADLLRAAIQEDAFKQGWAEGHNKGYLEGQADAKHPGMREAMRIIEKVGTTGIEHEHLNAQQWLLRYFPEHA